MNLSYNEIKEELNNKQKQLEAFQAYFEDFNKYDLALSLANAQTVDIYTFIIELKNRAKSEKVLNAEKNINSLIHFMNVISGLNARCQTQKLTIKHQMTHIHRLEEELKSIKDALNADN